MFSILAACLLLKNATVIDPRRSSFATAGVPVMQTKSNNPLDDIHNTRSIVTVFHDGIEYDPAKLFRP